MTAPSVYFFSPPGSGGGDVSHITVPLIRRGKSVVPVIGRGVTVDRPSNREMNMVLRGLCSLADRWETRSHLPDWARERPGPFELRPPRALWRQDGAKFSDPELEEMNLSLEENEHQEEMVAKEDGQFGEKRTTQKKGETKGKERVKKEELDEGETKKMKEDEDKDMELKRNGESVMQEELVEGSAIGKNMGGEIREADNRGKQMAVKMLLTMKEKSEAGGLEDNAENRRVRDRNVKMQGMGQDSGDGKMSDEGQEIQNKEAVDVQAGNVLEPQKTKCSGKNAGKLLRELQQSLEKLGSPEEQLIVLSTQHVQLMQREQTAHHRLNALSAECTKLTIDLQKMVSTRARLESLCRELQHQSKILLAENEKKGHEEEQKRLEVTQRFEEALDEVRREVGENEARGSQLRQENQELAAQLRDVVEQTRQREEQVAKLIKFRELHQQLAEVKLQEEQAIRCKENEKFEQDKEFLLRQAAESKVMVKVLEEREEVFKKQLVVYSEKIGDFQTMLSKSNDTFGSFRKDMEEMSKKVVRLEKEALTWKGRWELSNQSLLDLAEKKLLRDKEAECLTLKLNRVERLCRALQSERTQLSAQLASVDSKSSTTSPQFREHVDSLEPEDMACLEYTVTEHEVLQASLNSETLFDPLSFKGTEPHQIQTFQSCTNVEPFGSECPACIRPLNSQPSFSKTPGSEPAAPLKPHDSDPAPSFKLPCSEPPAPLNPLDSEPSALVKPPSSKPLDFLEPPNSEPPAPLNPPDFEPTALVQPPSLKPLEFLEPPNSEPPAPLNPLYSEPAALVQPPSSKPLGFLEPPNSEPLVPLDPLHSVPTAPIIHPGQKPRDLLELPDSEPLTPLKPLCSEPATPLDPLHSNH
uniref:Uncharacterized protein n=2 Tax=Eptatretus burgeri TaxID=7764 RepID=A0A8C4WTN4_EPTBU